MEQEGRVAGQQHHRPLAALGDRCADGVGQTGAEMTEVLVPDHVARLRLRVRPLEDDRRAAVAHHDAVLANSSKALVASTTKRAGCTGVLPAGASPATRASSAASALIQISRLGGRVPRGVPQRLDQLRHDAAQIADQRHVDRPVHADRGRILLDVSPICGSHRCWPNAESGRSGIGSPSSVPSATHRSDSSTASICGRGEQVWERPVLQSRDERRATGRLDHRAGHQLGEFLDLAPVRDV